MKYKDAEPRQMQAFAKIAKKIAKEIAPSPGQEREAKQLLKQNALLFFRIDEIETLTYKIQAMFKYLYAQDFYVSLSISKHGKLLEAETDMPRWIEYEPYVMVLLMQIRRSANLTVPFYFENPVHKEYIEQKRKEEEEKKLRLQRQLLAQSEHWIDSYKEAASQEITQALSPVKASIVTFIDWANEDRLSFRFKVGQNQKYMISDIREFLLNIANEAFITYGKKLAFKHSLTNFDEDALRIIDFLRGIVATYDFDNQRSSKEIYFTKSSIDQFFDFYLDIPSNYREFNLTDNPQVPTLAFEDLGDKYSLSLRFDQNFYIGKKHAYTFEAQTKTISCIKLDEAGKVNNLISTFNAEGQILLSKEKIPDFYSYVLSDVKNFIDFEGFDIRQLEIQEEQSITLYGDIDDKENLFLNLEYEYEDGEKEKGFNEKNHKLSVSAKRIEAYISSLADIRKNTAFMDINEDKTIDFIRLGLTYLDSYCDVRVTDALKRIGNKQPYSLNIGVTVNNDLLEINLDSLNIPKEDLGGVLNAYKRKRKFYKLKNGEQLYLNGDALDEATQMLDAYNVNPNEIKDGNLTLDLFRAFSVDDFANQNSDTITFDRSEIFNEIVERFSNIQKSVYTLPTQFDSILRDYQKYGFQWMQTIREYGFGGILADDMGLGKTLQVITIFSENKREKMPHLVICPASLILNWVDEIKKFAPDLKAVAVYKDVNSRTKILADYQEFDIVITSYDYIKRDVEKYEDLLFNYIVLDEAQYIKNPKTKGAQTVKELKGKHKLALTGTPIENSLAELWSIFDFLMPGYLYHYSHFKQTFESPIVKSKDEKAQQELKKLISPFILRRTKKQVLTELPDKIENTIAVEFSEEENKLYLANLVQVNDQLREKLQVDGKSAHIEILAMLTRLRQICCEPRTLYENITTPSSKLENCIELIRTLKENNKKILLFSSFTGVLDLISDELKKEKISYYTLTGATNKDKRRELVANFQEDDTTVFLISLKAGGTGLNLTAAEAVIHFDPWWNISAQNQATDRAHRFGQEQVVQVFKLIMKNSIEEKILALQEAKKHLSDTFVEGNDGTITNMSTDDLLDLFKS